MRSDIEVTSPHNKLMFRMTGWEDRRLDLPRRFYDFRISPVDVLLSDVATGQVQMLPEPTHFRCTMLSPLPEEIFEAHGGIWLLVLAYMVLNRTERQVWQALTGKRRIEWLLGRIAAKDAVRLYLRERFNLVLCPADIEITANAAGALQVRGSWVGHVGPVPSLSISHTDGLAIAIAGCDSGGSAIGADVEQIGRFEGDVKQLVLSAGERKLLADLDGAANAAWATRLWCAKEAVGKALGTGVIGYSELLQVQDVDVRTGRVNVLILPHALPGVCGVQDCVVAYTSVEGAHAFGTALV